MTVGKHKRVLAEQQRQWSAALRRAVKDAEREANEKTRELIPRLAAATLEHSPSAGFLRLEVRVTGRIVEEMLRYPGDRQVALEYLGEQLGYEVTRHLKSLDFGTVIRASQGRQVEIFGPDQAWGR